MTKVSEKSVKKLIEQLNKYCKGFGERGFAVDIKEVQKLVRKNRDAVEYVVKSYCTMAQIDPRLFQHALFIASVYESEFEDSSLVETVAAQAKAAGAEK